MKSLALVTAALLLVVWPARGQDMWAIPGEPVAYWAMDPEFLGDDAATDPNRALLETALVALLGRVIPGAGPDPALAALLSPEVLGSAPYRLVLLDLAVQSEADPAPGVPVQSILATGMLQIETVEPDPIQRVIRELLEKQAKAAGTTASYQELALDGSLVAIRSGSLMWVDGDGVFTVAFGDMPIEDALALSRAESPAWLPYRQRCAGIHHQGTTTFEAFVNLDRLRVIATDEAGWGTLGELLAAWRISNARGLMLRAKARDSDSGANAIDVCIAWASRTQPPTLVRGASLTHGHWPRSLGDAPEDAVYTLAIAAPPQLVVALAASTYEALAWDDPTFAQRKLEWVRRFGPRLDRLIREFSPAIGIAGPGHSIGSPSLYLPIRSGPMVREDVSVLLGSFEPLIGFDEQTNTWQIPTGGDAGTFLLAPAAPGLVGAWNPEQVISTESGR